MLGLCCFFAFSVKSNVPKYSILTWNKYLNIRKTRDFFLIICRHPKYVNLISLILLTSLEVNILYKTVKILKKHISTFSLKNVNIKILINISQCLQPQRFNILWRVLNILQNSHLVYGGHDETLDWIQFSIFNGPEKKF